MNEGDIIKFPLPQSDGQIKFRPALILKKVPPFNDMLICGISSKLHNQVKDLDIIINKKHPDFKRSGLKVDSLIRTAYLVLVPQNEIPGSIGSLSFSTHQEVLIKLSDFLLRN